MYLILVSSDGSRHKNGVGRVMMRKRAASTLCLYGPVDHWELPSDEERGLYVQRDKISLRVIIDERGTIQRDHVPDETQYVSMIGVRGRNRDRCLQMFTAVSQLNDPLLS